MKRVVIPTGQNEDAVYAIDNGGPLATAKMETILTNMRNHGALTAKLNYTNKTHTEWSIARYAAVGLPTSVAIAWNSIFLDGDPSRVPDAEAWRRWTETYVDFWIPTIEPDYVQMGQEVNADLFPFATYLRAKIDEYDTTVPLHIYRRDFHFPDFAALQAKDSINGPNPRWYDYNDDEKEAYLLIRRDIREGHDAFGQPTVVTNGYPWINPYQDRTLTTGLADRAEWNRVCLELGQQGASGFSMWPSPYSHAANPDFDAAIHDELLSYMHTGRVHFLEGRARRGLATAQGGTQGGSRISQRRGWYR